jgi:heat shock protein HslJ
MTRSHQIRAVLVVSALLLAACGSDDTTETTAASDPVATTTGSPTTETTTAEPADTPVPTLAGTSWTVTFYNMNTGAMTNVVGDTKVTMVFGDDGTISGSTGCNEYSGTYEVAGPYDEFEEGVRDENDGQAIQIGSITVTERGCEGAFVMEQEAELLQNLRGVETWFLARDGMILRGDGAFIEAVPS